MIENKNIVNLLDKKSRFIRLQQLTLGLVLGTTLLFFLILPLRDIALRHGVVFIGSLVFYAIAGFRLIRAKMLLKEFYLLASFFVLFFIQTIIHFELINLEIIYSTLNFIALTIILATSSRAGVINSSKTWILSFALLTTVILFVLSKTGIAYLSETGFNNGFLVLGMTNSNLTGMLIFGVYSILLIYFNASRHKAITGIALFALLYLIYLTGSRSALISVLVVSVYAFFLSSRKLPKWLIITTSLLPIIVIPIYLMLYNQWGEYAVFLGKPLFSGRELILIQIFEDYRSYSQILFGDFIFKNFVNNTAPNAPLAIYLFSGLFGALLFYILIIRRILKRNQQAVSSMARIAIICLLSFFVQSSVEVFLFTGGFPGITFMYLISVLMDD